MHRLGRIALSTAVTLSSLAIPAVAHASASGTVPVTTAAARTVPGQLVVVFGSRSAAASARRVHDALGAEVVRRSSSPVAQVIRLPVGRSVDAAIERYERLPGVVAAEADRVAEPFGALPTDPLFGQQWGLHNTGQSHPATNVGLPGPNAHGRNDADVDAPEAWATTTGDPSVVIAVIDTGVDLDHPGIEPNLWENTAEATGTPGVDDDDNGFVDDVNGWDFENGDKDPSPGPGLSNAHGTHVAGIAAAPQDAEGISGICPGCSIMPLRFDFSVGQELQAIDYAVDNGADIINMSFGSPIFSKAERAKIDAAGTAGVLTVASAGNSSVDNDISAVFSNGDFGPSFPASLTLDSILAVAASNDRDQYGYFSQCRGDLPFWQCAWSSWGHDSVDLAAPGTDITSSVTVNTGPGNAEYDTWDGTSMSAPMVAGIAGLVWSANPGYSHLDVKNAVMNGVDQVDLDLFNFHGDDTGTGRGALSGSFTRAAGRANAAGALVASVADATPLTDGNVDGAVSAGRRERGRVTWPRDVNDVYERRLRRGRTYEIRLDGRPDRRDLDLLVWIPGTLEIFQFTAGCFRPQGSCPALRAASASPDGDERVRFRAKETGRYFIQVNGWYASGRYTLTVRRG